MKGIILAIAFSLAATLHAQTPQNVRFYFTEASDLTLVGKIHQNTTNPYHRVDTLKFSGFTKSENRQVRMSAGIAVAFKTTSTVISVKTDYSSASWPDNTNGYSARGYDLYIKREGKWIYAASGVSDKKRLESNLILIRDMNQDMKECLLYLPLYSVLNSVKIGVQKNSDIEAVKTPFRYRVGVFGSSFTHGSSTSRSGMTWPAQFSRNTGIELLSLGCSGNCKLQPYFADVLAAADVDAFLFDTFSNPNVKEIEERLVPFIEKIQEAHPDKPLIFLKTIRRESRNFSHSAERREKERMDKVDAMMKEMQIKYDHVYYIEPNATSDDHNASVDGTHPTNYGYTLWAKSIEKPVLKILKKHGIK